MGEVEWGIGEVEWGSVEGGWASVEARGTVEEKAPPCEVGCRQSHHQWRGEGRGNAGDPDGSPVAMACVWGEGCRKEGERWGQGNGWAGSVMEWFAWQAGAGSQME